MLGYKLFESNTIGDDASYAVSNTIYVAQTFTPGTAHNLFTIAVKAINVATCGDVTIKIYHTDALGKPTGTALATMTITTVPTGTADWMYDELSSALEVDNSELIAVIHSAAAGLYLRYQTVGTYGKAWASTDSGATWAEIAGSSFLFQDWGQALSLYGTYRVPLYPIGTGTYSQLYSLNQVTKPNYMCVDDTFDAVDDSVPDSVVYALDTFGYYGTTYTADDVFLSGLSDGAAGYVTGTSLLWKNGVDGVWGTGTSLLSEIDVDYLLRSPTKNEWYKGGHIRVSKVESVDSDTEATLTEITGDEPVSLFNRDLKKVWFYYPNNTTLADGGMTRNGYMMLGMPHDSLLPMRFMSGIWTFVTDSDTVTATGGSALSLYPDPDFIYNFISTGPNAAKNYGFFYPIGHVDGDNQVTLWSEFELGAGLPGIHRVGIEGASKYAYFGFLDDLSADATATQFCKPTKMDSYLVKSSMNKGNIERMSVRFRAFIEHKETTSGTSLTATAQPFVYLNGVFSYGTEQTITSTEQFADYPLLSRSPLMFEFEETISRPGGGVFTWDEMGDVEVGIILGDLNDTSHHVAVCCSQLCLIAEVSKIPVYILQHQNIGLDDVGFIAFGDKWSEFNQYIGGDGVDTLGWRVNYLYSFFGRWVAKPFKKIRSVGVRLVRPISRVLTIRRR